MLAFTVPAERTAGDRHFADRGGPTRDRPLWPISSHWGIAPEGL